MSLKVLFACYPVLVIMNLSVVDVQVYDSNDCEATDTIVVSECTGIHENELSGVSIYPNPNNGQFVIDLQNADNAQIKVLTRIIHTRTL